MKDLDKKILAVEHIEERSSSRVAGKRREHLTLLGLALDYPIDEVDRNLIPPLERTVYAAAGGPLVFTSNPAMLYALFACIVAALGIVSVRFSWPTYPHHKQTIEHGYSRSSWRRVLVWTGRQTGPEIDQRPEGQVYGFTQNRSHSFTGWEKEGKKSPSELTEGFLELPAEE